MSDGVRQPAAAGSRPDAPGLVSRPPNGDLLLMTVAVLAVSTSGPLIAATAAPALAVAFWRNAFATAALSPFALTRALGELRRLSSREWRWTVGAGVMLAAHFATWVPSLRLTSVASATALVATTPVWTALLARVAGQHVPARAWLGIALSIAAVVVLTGVDFSLEPRALAGDLLALAGGFFAALYTVAGGEVRRTVSTVSYTFVCYGVCSVVLGVAALASGARLTGFPAEAWLGLVALTVGPQLLGHSLFNRVLRTTSPTVVALAILFEVPGAALIAAVFLDQVPPLAVVPAAVLLLAGLATVVSSRPRGVEVAIPTD